MTIVVSGPLESLGQFSPGHPPPPPSVPREVGTSATKTAIRTIVNARRIALGSDPNSFSFFMIPPMSVCFCPPETHVRNHAGANGHASHSRNVFIGNELRCEDASALVGATLQNHPFLENMNAVAEQLNNGQWLTILPNTVKYDGRAEEIYLNSVGSIPNASMTFLRIATRMRSRFAVSRRLP